MTAANTLIIIPTYNERENIGRLLPELFASYPDVHVLVVDDDSPDQTALCVQELQATYVNQLFLMQRSGKQGLGTAYIAGFRWALERSYDYIFEMDADFSHPVRSVADLYQACARDGYDVAIGSRYVKGGRVLNWPVDRVLLSYYASVYVRLITWMPVQDATAGFVCYRRQVLDTLDLNRIRFVGYAFQIEMKYAAWCLGFRIKEIPITFVDRMEGLSKMNKGIVKEAALGVLRMRWQSLFRSYRRS
ncbi:MAG: polyprenol monophosphomannose synthase [Chitinophagales bacterium]|nr:polyprenol monophosphomannose synthase [Chitinophagales bacterium]MDW8393464.1 polyprenol monophosphomannose synthase [Chitinophagales bacterium]